MFSQHEKQSGAGCGNRHRKIFVTKTIINYKLNALDENLFS